MKKQLIIIVIVNIVMGVLAVFPAIIAVISTLGGMGVFDQAANSDVFVGILMMIGIFLIVFIVNRWFFRRLESDDKKLMFVGPSVFLLALIVGYFTMI